MTKIEALEMELKARKMVDGTGLDWWDVTRVEHVGSRFYNAIAPHWRLEDIELALGILEGKPVWEGDKIYCEGSIVYATDCCAFNNPSWSWNPTAPKTVTIELLIEDAEQIVYWHGNQYETRLKDACRKALEELKWTGK